MCIGFGIQCGNEPMRLEATEQPDYSPGGVEVATWEGKTFGSGLGVREFDNHD